MSRLARYRDELAALDAAGRRRALSLPGGLDFASNDYLALGRHPRLAQAVTTALAAGTPVGAGASRLLRGHHDAHAALERAAAGFFGAPAALYLATGFAANQAIWSALPRVGDAVVFDALSHASTRTGLTAGAARALKAAHNDPQAMDDALARWRAGGGKGQAWLAVESVYSMDGDTAPIDALMDVAERHDAWLVVDEAHATGVLGTGGRGLTHGHADNDRLIALHTCGKALGVVGGLVTGPAVIIDTLINTARPFIYSTAPSPLLAAAVTTALELAADADEARSALQRRVARLAAGLAALGLPASGSHIAPVILGADERAVQAATALQAGGFDVRAVRPPTVAEGTARLRISVTLNVSEQDVDDLLAALGRVIEGCQP